MVAHESGLSHLVAALGHRARRIVSEDSIHPIASLSTAVHPFPESKNLMVVLVAEVVGREQRYCASPQPIVLRLLSHDRKPIEERHNAAGEIEKSVDLPIPATVARLAQSPAPEGHMKQIQRDAIVLRDVEGGRELEAPAIVAAFAADDHEASLSQRKPRQEATEGGRYGLDAWPFLLIVRTRHIFTVPPTWDGTRSAGYSDIPAYSQVL